MESSGKLKGALATPPTNYGAVPAVEPLDKERAEASSSEGGCCQFRLLMYVMIFLGGAISYALRVSLSQAIVAMVNQTTHQPTHNASADTDELCLNDDVNTTSDDVTTGGEFNWDRNTQGAVLAAFYYGYALIQVNLQADFIWS